MSQERCQRAKSAILDRQLGQRRRQAAGERRVERADLAHQHRERPAVRDDVMHGGEEQARLATIRGKTQPPDAEERSVGRGRRRARPPRGRGAALRLRSAPPRPDRSTVGSTERGRIVRGLHGLDGLAASRPRRRRCGALRGAARPRRPRRRERAGASSPSSRRASGMLYTAEPGARRSRNQRRSWAKESGSAPSSPAAREAARRAARHGVTSRGDRARSAGPGRRPSALRTGGRAADRRRRRSAPARSPASRGASGRPGRRSCRGPKRPR